MLNTLKVAFDTMKMEGPNNELIDLHSNTSKEQGLFLQEIFDLVKPTQSLEVGLAYGISTLFILEKHREKNSNPKSHIVIEPFPWAGVPEHNIKKENLFDLVDIRYQKSHDVLPRLFYENQRIQFAYIDTTKLFDIVMQDCYFIDKMLDINGVIVLDDCGGGWPGIQRVARFMNSMPHYQLLKGFNKNKKSKKRKIAESIIKGWVRLVPFKDKVFLTQDFSTDTELNLDYSCLAFKKISEDTRNWDFDKKI